MVKNMTFVVNVVFIVLLLVISTKQSLTADFNNDGYDDLAVGAPGESPGSAPESGYVFVFKGSATGLVTDKGLGQAGLGADEFGDDFGAALAVGDFNNDGYDDLAIGAPGESPGSSPESGYVFIFRGSATGLAADKGLSQAALGANEVGDDFGTALAVGDFNNDGFDDLAVGAPGEAPGSEPNSGYVFIFNGSAGGLIASKGLSQAGLGANEADDRFGIALVAGDFNNDGFDDLAVGAPGEAPGSAPKSGYVFVFKGSAAGLVTDKGFGQAGLGANEAGDDFGAALAVGDFNNDGFDDLAVGAPGEYPGSQPESGYVYIFAGSAAGLAADKGLSQAGLGANEAGDDFGAALTVGDFNNDGFDDLAVGAPGEAPGSEPNSGYVFIFNGSAGGLNAFQGLNQNALGANEARDNFGASLTTGDFDNDGFDDLVVGAPGESPGSDPESGYIFVFHGAVGGLYPFSGLSQAGLGANEAGDRFGVALPGSPAYKRRAFVEIDKMTGTGFPPQQVVDGNYIHTLESIYLKGGMVLDVRRDDTNIPNQVSVSRAEIHNLMTANKNANFEEAGDKWSGYIVVVTSLTGSPGTYGVMFDNDADDLNNFPREGCAIFETPINNDFGANAQKAMFFTSVHEFGHVFNLHHGDWEGNTFYSGSTIMSYSFPNNLWRLSKRSKNHLRHHPNLFVKPGQGGVDFLTVLPKHENMHH